MNKYQKILALVALVAFSVLAVLLYIPIPIDTGTTAGIEAAALMVLMLSCILFVLRYVKPWRQWTAERIERSPRLGGQTAKMRDALRRKPPTE